MAGSSAVLFDLDDTLYPEAEFVHSGFRAVAAWGREALGLPAESSFERLWGLFQSGVRRNTFDLWLDGHAAIAQAVAVYRSHLPTIHPFPEVPGLLGELSLSHRLGVVTDGEAGMQHRKLAALGLEASFAVVICTHDLGPEHSKPSPRPFLLALERLGASAGCYIGDNPMKDFLGARQAGLRTIQVHRPGGIYSGATPPSPEHRPDHVLDSLVGLAPLLASSEARR